MIKAYQTKQEEIGTLPEKEFRIMIVKIIQNLERYKINTQKSVTFIHREKDQRAKLKK